MGQLRIALHKKQTQSQISKVIAYIVEKLRFNFARPRGMILHKVLFFSKNVVFSQSVSDSLSKEHSSFVQPKLIFLLNNNFVVLFLKKLL